MKNDPIFSLPEPCNESWRKMTPQQEGRLCAACDTVVVDFTAKTETEIIAYFEQRKEQKICGKYRAEHVAVPGRRMRFKWLAAALALLVGSSFISSCRRHVHGKVSAYSRDTKQHVQTHSTQHKK
jgi:hypothetical protein